MIKALSRCAGFPEKEAEYIAYASEFVDDSLEFLPVLVEGISDVMKDSSSHMLLKGKNNELFFDVVCTAHDEDTMLGGVLNSGQQRTYVPFHFIPRSTGKSNHGFDYRTAPNCDTAKALMEQTLAELKDAALGKGCDLKVPVEDGLRVQKLIKFGIALHSYADTWAHQNFSGLFDPSANSVDYLHFVDTHNQKSVSHELEGMPAFVPETGHAKAHGFPDSSHLRWTYRNGANQQLFERDNPVVYLDATENIFTLLCQAAQMFGYQAVRAWDGNNGVKKLAEQCINYDPGTFIWKQGGTEAKIQKYKEVFSEYIGSAAYDPFQWKAQALRPYIQNGNERHNLDFYNKEHQGRYFNLKQLGTMWWEKLKQDVRDKMNSKLELAADIFMGWVSGRGAIGAIVNTLTSSIQRWVSEYKSIRYVPAVLSDGGSIDAAKWFFFHYEADANRRFVLERTPIPVVDPYADCQGDFGVAITKKLPDFDKQLGRLIINTLEATVAKPGDFHQKWRWMEFELRNHTDGTIAWAGSSTEDFGFSGASGRYWARPDDVAFVAPGASLHYSACERDNAVTGCCGVTPFVIRHAQKGDVSFSIGFSNPLSSEVGPMLKRGWEMAAAEAEYIALVARRKAAIVAYETEKAARRWIPGVSNEPAITIPPEPQKPVLDVEMPKCQGSFSSDRARIYDALGEAARSKNLVSHSIDGRQYTISVEPGKRTVITVSVA